MSKSNKIAKLNRIKIKYCLIVLALAVLLFAVCKLTSTFMKYYYKVTVQAVGYAKETRSSSYTVKFYPNTGTGSMPDQSIQYNVPTNLNSNTFTKTDYVFNGWNTEPDGSGTSYSDGQEILNTTEDVIDLYAQWAQGVALIVGDPTPYYTLQAAITAAGTGSQKTIKLLANVSENVIVAKNQNIVFNLQNYAISITNGAAITNNGTLSISNGTITSSSTSDGVINNKSTGTLKISGGRVLNTAVKGKQAIYNDKGTVEITGTAYISASSSTAAGNNQRATVQNLAGGTLTITGGTIVSLNFDGIVNAGTMTIGTEDRNININSPVIQAERYGVNSSANYAFYDGIIKGKNDALNDKNKINAKEADYDIASGEEIISGSTYKTAYLAQTNTVEFDSTGGNISEATRNIENGKPVGTLPIPNRTGYIFDGWFTMKNGGTKVTASTIVTSNVTYYAHWTKVAVAKIGETEYDTLQDAINTVPANTETTVELIKNTNENITIAANKNVILDLNNNTISITSSGAVITNNGTLTILNGTISSTVGTGTINNYAGATLKIRGGTISGTQRSAIYNTGGIVEISGGTLTSGATGTPTGSTLERATVQNLQKGTVTITGGTIIGTQQQAISNEATLIIGTKDGNINATSPEIRGGTYGIVSNATINFYDGIVKGIDGSISGTITEIEDDSQEVDSTETISDETYITKYLELIP